MTTITDAAQRYEVYSTIIEALSVSADLMFLSAIIETYTDPLDATLSREAVDLITDALLNPNEARPAGELFISTMVQQ